MDHFFRHEAGRIVSLLAKIFGMDHLQLAEDMVQETLLEAFSQWSYGSLPDNPGAWVMAVAKRKVLNELKRKKILAAKSEAIGLEYENPEDLDPLFDEAHIADSMLRMFFVCCDPALPVESRLVLTLKILCGFSSREIAGALLLREAAVDKRLYRSKTAFRRRRISLEIPGKGALEARLDSVNSCIYLLFNEGYNSSHPDFLIRKDLCAEAMRLCRLVIDYFPGYYASHALLSLMCFHAARFDSRLDDHGALVIFAEQDRTAWGPELIRMGRFYLAESAQGERLTEYHLEAGIAAEHCLANSFAETRWDVIDRDYAVLAQLKDNPVIELNRAVILSMTSGPRAAMEKLEELRNHPRLRHYYLLHATLGELHARMGEMDKARECLAHAISRTSSNAEKRFLRKSLERIIGLEPTTLCLGSRSSTN